MAANGEIALAWADGEHKFNIAKIGQILELEEKCGCGVAEIYSRIREARWRFNDLRETIRLGLIGAGIDPNRALILTKRYVDERPWAENVQVALAILLAAMIGVQGDPVGKKPTADRTATNEAGPSTATAGLSDPQSMDSAARSAGIPDKSMN
jgi:tail tube GTA-gp10-like protein